MTKRYRNVGVTNLHLSGQVVAPGDTYVGELSETHERQMLVGGHLAIEEEGAPVVLDTAVQKEEEE